MEFEKFKKQDCGKKCEKNVASTAQTKGSLPKLPSSAGGLKELEIAKQSLEAREVKNREEIRQAIKSRIDKKKDVRSLAE